MRCCCSSLPCGSSLIRRVVWYCGQRCTLGELLTASRQHVAESTTREHLLAAVQWLDLTGDAVLCRSTGHEEAVAVEAKEEETKGDTPIEQTETSGSDNDVVFLDPTWLCQTLVGRMTASAELLRKQGRTVVWEDGLHNPTMAQVMKFARVLQLDVREEVVCHVFEHFKLGVRYRKAHGRDRMMVPMRLTSHAFAVVDRSVLDGCERVLGRQLRARPPNVFVPGFFPQLQLKAFQEHDALLWRSGLLLQRKSSPGNTYAVIEAAELAALDESATLVDATMTHVTALNIYVWGHATPGAESDPMLELLRTCERLVMDVLFEMVGVGANALRQHRLEMLALGPGCVRRWTEGHRTPCRYELYREPYTGEHVSYVEPLQPCRNGFDPAQTTTLDTLINGKLYPLQFDPIWEIWRYVREEQARNEAAPPAIKRRSQL